MKSLIIEQTKYTPEISLDYDRKFFSFIGKSYPENTFYFYKGVVDWLEEYFKRESQGLITINFEIIYFNSSSSKLFFDLLDLFEAASASHNIQIDWVYDSENESALEAGEDFKEDFESLNFNLIEK